MTAIADAPWLLKRRKWVVDFGLWAGRLTIKNFLHRYLPGLDSESAIDTRAQRDARHGIWPYPEPQQTNCVRTLSSLEPGEATRDADSVAKMRNLYSTEGTVLILNVAPVATCDKLQDAYSTLLAGLHDNRFESLPISYFNEGDVHFSPEGSRHISVEAANQILSLEKQRKSSPLLTSETSGPAK